MLSRRHLLFAPLALAQEAPTIRITVTLVQIDAVVTDARGKHVDGLGPDDFEVRQDGEPVKIQSFAYVPEPPPERAVKRTVALVVDDLALSFENLVRTRESLKKYVNTAMREGDLVAVVRTGGGVAVLEQFTTDKRILLAAIDLMKWRFHGRAGLKSIEALNGDSAAGPQLLDYGVEVTEAAVGALATLEMVVKGMRRLPGRKSIVYLASALGMAPEVARAMERLTDLANRSAVSIYTIDPKGLTMTAEEGDTGTLFADSLGRAYAPEEGLIYLARKTGGLYYANNNDIPGCIARAAEDQMGYYLMGYTPQEGTFADARKFHAVTVWVKKPGLRVRWKSGFMGVPDEEALREAGPRTREQQLMDALASPFLATGIRVRLTGTFLHATGLGARVHTMLHFDAKDLTFAKQADGDWLAKVDIVTSAYRGLKQTSQQRERQEELRLPDEVYQKARKEGFLYLMDHPMAEPGTFLMRAVVRDVASERIGAASQLVEVPDTRKGRMAVSGILLRLAPKGMVATPELTGDTGTAAWTEGGPAVRRYRQGQDILYTFVAIQPRTRGKDKQADATSTAHVYRNGKRIFSGQPLGLAPEAKLDAGHFVGAGILRLGPRMAAGEYLLQVVVTSRKKQVASWIDFEVVRS
jgi:VWFA-related protein